MKKRALWKDLFVEIRKSRNRFLSIFMIVFLGAAFLSGIQATNPDMRLSADQFYDASNLMDIRVLSTLGLTEEDAQAIEDIEGVRKVVPAYSADMFSEHQEEQISVKVMSEPEGINELKLDQGRLPLTPEECLVDVNLLESYDYQIGDKIKLKPGTDDPIEDTLAETEYTIVGAGTTSYYLSLERGTTSIGNGTLSGFVIVPKESFALEVYTEIYILAEDAKEMLCYSEEYEAYMEEICERIEEIADARCEIRYTDIFKEAEAEIADAEKEIAEAEAEIADAEKQLAGAREELDDGWVQLEEAAQTITDAEKQIADAEQQLRDGRKRLESGKAEVTSGEAQIAQQEAAYNAGVKELEAARTQLDESGREIQQAKQQLELLQQLIWTGGPEVLEQIAYLNYFIQEGEKQIASGEQEYAAGQTELAAGRRELDAAGQTIRDNKNLLEQSERELETAEREVVSAKAELETGRREYREAQAELEDGEQSYAEGQAELEESKAEYEPQLMEARMEIADARQALDELEAPEWYVLDRQYIQTYVEYGQDADRIGAIGEVFPYTFFLVAALVSLTTMTRMVEEERTQIGTLKALGYTRGDVAVKYIFYAAAASLSGSIGGVIFGQKVLPYVIIVAYKMLYNNLPAVVTPIHGYYSALAIGASVVCTIGATLFACYKEFLAVPAQLMRPAAPKSGKRVFLERIGFIWRRLNFTYKATVRNLIRYKKRFFMTIFGMGGCMALLLVGFGVNDSIMSIAELQYGRVHIYDAAIAVDGMETAEEVQEQLNLNQEADSSTAIYQTSVDAGYGKTTKSAYIFAVQEKGILQTYTGIQDRSTGETYELTDDGVIITEKLAQLLGVEAGDTIYLKEDEATKLEVEITAVTENYFLHYIYMTQSLYEQLYEETFEPNQVLVINGELTEEKEDVFKERYMEIDGVNEIALRRASASKALEMLGSMDMIIYVLVISAALLAFVVLFNLNNINISERKRELATLKVLGFFDGEVSAYVLRENIMLTVIGSAVGIVMGIFLHRYVILTAELDIIMFGRDIFFKSYVYSVAFTMFFSLVVNGVMYFKLKKIDMVESMKSVE